MAFKMAENSLFAILTRSPWWYSVAIGLVFIAISFLVFNGQYIVLGFFTASPFLGIAAYSAFTQSQRPSHKRMVEADNQARNMGAAQLALNIADCYTTVGYESEAFKGGAADLVLSRSNRKILLNAKRFKVGNTGIEPLKQLVAAGNKVEATGYIHVALGEISDAARQYAKQNDIELVQADRLAEYFDKKVSLV